MSTSDHDLPRVTRFLNRLEARRSTFGGRVAAFVSQPDPRTIGSFARGRQLCAGNFLFAGHLVRDPDKTPWDIPPPTSPSRERCTASPGSMTWPPRATPRRGPARRPGSGAGSSFTDAGAARAGGPT